jgi:hypothetical protein
MERTTNSCSILYEGGDTSFNLICLIIPEFSFMFITSLIYLFIPMYYLFLVTPTASVGREPLIGNGWRPYEPVAVSAFFFALGVS